MREFIFCYSKIAICLIARKAISHPKTNVFSTTICVCEVIDGKVMIIILHFSVLMRAGDGGENPHLAIGTV